jgi:formylglycine-generating enzyme required for sulfatase activity
MKGPLALSLYVGTLFAPAAGLRSTAIQNPDNEKSVMAIPRTGPLRGITAYTGSYSLFVGVGNYPGLPQIKCAPNDARTMRQILVDKYGFDGRSDHCVVLTDADATKARIEREISRLCDIKRVTPTDRVLIYFSCHGQGIPLADGGNAGYLLPYDASVKLGETENPSDYLISCVDMGELVQHLRGCPAKHKLVIIDACFSGFATSSKGLGGHRYSPEALRGLLDQQGLAVMTASDDKQESEGEKSINGLSLYTRALVDCLDEGSLGGGTFTAEELATEARGKTIDRSNSRQTPTFRVLSGSGQMLFFSTLAPSASPNASRGGFSLSRPGKAKGETRTSPIDGSEFVWIPEGVYLFGPKKESRRLAGYWIAKNDVTWGQYKRFCEETKRVLPPLPTFPFDDSHPVVWITLQDARDYASWAGCRLPTEEQWEKAARGTDGRIYPWGDHFDASKCQTSVGKEASGTAPADHFPDGASPFGCLDMAGNVWQWTDSELSPKHFIARGGSWSRSNPRSLQADYRIASFLATSRSGDLGFRLAGPELP